MVRGSNFSRHQEWKERFARYLKSGLTVAEFCEWEGVSTASFYNWRKKLAGDTPSRSRSGCKSAARCGPASEISLERNSFLPVRVTSCSASTPAPSTLAASRIEIRLTNGVCIFVSATDSDSLNILINSVCRLSSSPRGEASEDQTEGIAC